MKYVRIYMSLAIVVTVVAGFSGCTVLDYGSAEFAPSVVHVGDPYTATVWFRSFEPYTVEVNSIDYVEYLDGEFYLSDTMDPSDAYWITGTVPPFEEVMIWRVEYTVQPGWVGSWEFYFTFHTSEGDFESFCTWTVLGASGSPSSSASPCSP